MYTGLHSDKATPAQNDRSEVDWISSALRLPARPVTASWICCTISARRVATATVNIGLPDSQFAWRSRGTSKVGVQVATSLCLCQSTKPAHATRNLAKGKRVPMFTAFSALWRRSSTSCRPPCVMVTPTSDSFAARAMARGRSSNCEKPNLLGLLRYL